MPTQVCGASRRPQPMHRHAAILFGITGSFVSVDTIVVTYVWYDRERPQLLAHALKTVKQRLDLLAPQLRAIRAIPVRRDNAAQRTAACLPVGEF